VELGNVDPFRLFGLPRDASLEEIRKRYRQLALAYHPDRRGGNDPRQAKRFALVRAAYEAILQARQAAEESRSYGPCPMCGELKALVRQLDGTHVCGKCMARSRWTRLLPAPPFVIVKCTFSIGCLVASVVCLVQFIRTGGMPYGLAAIGIALAGFIVIGMMGLMYRIVPARDLRRAREMQSLRAKFRFPW
jgi:hypothetical protein